MSEDWLQPFTCKGYRAGRQSYTLLKRLYLVGPEKLNMDVTLVMDVLSQALEKYEHPEIFNTDQGSQYTSHEHTRALIDRKILISMDGKGRATDNICIEHFWRSAKCERIDLNE